VYEGGLKRGPTPTGGYYDVLDLSTAPWRAGRNVVAIFALYLGRRTVPPTQTWWNNEHADSGQHAILVYGARFDKKGHSRMSHACSLEASACDQWHSSRVSTFLPVHSYCKLGPNTEGLQTCAMKPWSPTRRGGPSGTRLTRTIWRAT
jgi:hypothetical protein